MRVNAIEGLLYSLLDASLGSESRLFLLALSASPDFPESLEKRLRSRLSTQRLLLTSPDWEAKHWLPWTSQLLTSKVRQIDSQTDSHS